ncbi:cytosine deaminase [Synechococcus sp. PROS-7-1]|uniref:amidohydrolase family protein n=1 Tax=Synechococcus sp. PROS-7-1 TaxID=1442556 RepID=UPI0016475A62|nr:amidohydrolase family protein [Synechococcus sp. PROS-7-1]QNI85771.1 cytosine deaminase [Synechococcus sp. PROS-7-1]
MRPQDAGTLRGRCPTSLVDLPPGVAPERPADGLLSVELRWMDGRITSVLPVADAQGMVLPRLVEPHAHLDKAFSWTDYPNRSGTYAGAMEANMREHRTRTADRVQERSERALALAWRHGLRAIRTHIDSLGPGAACSWEVLTERRQQWKKRIELQLVALVPIAHWSTPEGEQLASQVAAAEGVIGGVIEPPCRGRAPRQALRHLLALAERLGCPVDLHIDEASEHPAAGVRQLLRVLSTMEVSVPITCSHASSLSLLNPGSLRRLGERMAEHHLQVVALPLTNGWLLGRRGQATPVQRPLAPIRQLRDRGVCVAVGGDNVQDPWFPGGNLDPLALMAMSVPLAQLAPWDEEGMAPFSTDAARLLGLAWDGVLRPGAPADLIHLPAGGWPELLSTPPQRKVLAGGVWVQD